MRRQATGTNRRMVLAGLLVAGAHPGHGTARFTATADVAWVRGGRVALFLTPVQT